MGGTGAEGLITRNKLDCMQEEFTLESYFWVQYTVMCNPGDAVMSAGYDIDLDYDWNNMNVSINRPYFPSSSTSEGCKIRLANDHAQDVTVMVRVLCIDL